MLVGNKLHYRFMIICVSLVVCALLLFSNSVIADRKFDKDKMERYINSLAENNKATLSVVFVEKGKLTYSQRTVTPSALNNSQLELEKKYKAG